MGLTFEKQFKLNSIIDRLVRPDSDACDIADGRDLRDIVFVDCGLRPVPSANLTHRYGSSSSETYGYAAGIGNITSLDSEQKTFQLGHGKKIFAGNWAIYVAPKELFRRHSSICVERRFNDTREMEDRESYMLVINNNHEPAEFQKMETKVITLYDFTLFGTPNRLQVGFPHLVTIKRPAAHNHG